MSLLFTAGCSKTVYVDTADAPRNLRRYFTVNDYIIKPGADLTNKNLTNADLEGASLTDANLTDAKLSDTFLWNAQMSGANLHGATR